MTTNKVYLAQINYSKYIQDLSDVGVFSTLDKAKEACNLVDIISKWDFLNRLWIGKSKKRYEFYISEYELDFIDNDHLEIIKDNLEWLES